MGEERFLQGDRRHQRMKTPVWYHFDSAWYRRRYGEGDSAATEATPDSVLKEDWNEGANGRSPNRYFDEEWYLQTYPDVFRAVRDTGIFQSGFQHYIDVGYHSCAGHWLFSLEHYLSKNQDYNSRSIYNEGYVNIYDHFLQIGDADYRSPHPFFDPEIFIKECLYKDVPFNPARGAFAQYLSLEWDEMQHMRTSWYFDPVWYLAQYPNVRALIEAGQFIGPLHHYLACKEATDYNPNPYFDEAYYLSQYPDIREAIDQGIFRNGYAHFIKSGVHEQRNPSPDLDMAAFIKTLDLPHALKAAHADNSFILWVMRQSEGESEIVAEPSITSSNALALEKVNASLPSLFRQPLRFVPVEHPPVTVILLSEGSYLLDIATLISIYQQNLPAAQIMVVGRGNHLAQKRLLQAVDGIDCALSQENIPISEHIQRTLPKIRSERVLLIETGTQLLPMALSGVLDVTQHEPVSIVGKLLTTTNKVLEAGSRVWRDGRVTAYGQGNSPTDQSVTFRREIEAVQGGLLLCRRAALMPVVQRLDDCPTKAFFTYFSIALRAVGERLLYEPSLQAKALSTTIERYAARAVDPLSLRQFYPSFLARHPIAQQGIIDAGDRQQPMVMMVFPHIPQVSEGGAVKRVLQYINIFRQLGWRVLIVGMEKGEEDRLTIPRDYPEDVECWGGVDDFQSFLEERQTHLKILWINSSALLNRLGPMLESGPISFADKAIVLDTVTIKAVGLEATETYLRKLVGELDEPDVLVKEAQAELQYAWLCQGIVVGDHIEQTLIRDLGYSNVVYLPYSVPDISLLSARQDDFKRRHGILFPLTVHRAGDAGHDGFDWFCLSVLPHLRQHFGMELPIWVGGYHHPSVDVSFYERLAPLDGFVSVDGLPHLMQTCRVLVAPMRVFGTETIEILEAAAQGLPAVISTPQMVRLGWRDGDEAVDGGLNNPQYFAQRLIALYEDEDLWRSVQKGGHDAVHKTHTKEVLETALTQFVNALFSPLTVNEAFAKPLHVPVRRKFAPAPLHVVAHPNIANVKDADKGGEDEDIEDETVPLPTHIGITLPNQNELDVTGGEGE